MTKFFKIILTLFLVGCATTPLGKMGAATGALYDSIYIEIQPTFNGGPEEEILTSLKRQLHNYHICHMSKIRIVVNKPVKTPRLEWTYNDIEKFEIKHRNAKDWNIYDRRLVLFISYIPGHSIEPNKTDIIGVKYDPTSIAYFTRAGGKKELSVLLHEIGHVIGLAVGRDDPVNPDRPNHCNNKRCIMYWIVPRIKNDKMPELDDECLKDLYELILDNQ